MNRDEAIRAQIDVPLLIKVLRKCGNQNDTCRGCPFQHMQGYCSKKNRDAADLIESLTADLAAMTAERYAECVDGSEWKEYEDGATASDGRLGE